MIAIIRETDYTSNERINRWWLCFLSLVAQVVDRFQRPQTMPAQEHSIAKSVHRLEPDLNLSKDQRAELSTFFHGGTPVSDHSRSFKFFWMMLIPKPHDFFQRTLLLILNLGFGGECSVCCQGASVIEMSLWEFCETNMIHCRNHEGSGIIVQLVSHYTCMADESTL